MERLEAWKISAELVAPLVEQHGVESYIIGNIFNPTTRVTPLEQHVNQILNVAEWLRGED